MRKGTVVGIMFLLLILRLHKLFISSKLVYRSSIDRFKMFLGIERGETTV
ncbi:MAG: hypothetical protein R6U44_06405 [Archaeoglobaceae archaeon]